MKSLLALISILCVSGCALIDPPGCDHDGDCKGDRVCVYGVCEAPEDAYGSGPSTGPSGPAPILSCGETALDCHCEATYAVEGQSIQTTACDMGYGVITTYDCVQECYGVPSWQIICGC